MIVTRSKGLVAATAGAAIVSNPSAKVIVNKQTQAQTRSRQMQTIKRSPSRSPFTFSRRPRS